MPERLDAFIASLAAAEQSAIQHATQRLLDGEVYCRRCVYFGQQSLTQVLRGGSTTPPQHWAVCRHPNAHAVRKDWNGVHHFRVPPWERNAQNDCADFVRWTLRQYVRTYPYRTGAWVLGFTLFLMWVLGW